MKPEDPVVCWTETDLKVVAVEMKFAAAPSCPKESYTKTPEEAERMARLEGMTEADREYYLNHGGNRGIWLNGQLISVCLTKGEEDTGAQWHLSLARVVGPQRSVATSDLINRTICNAFFSKWQQIENPGHMHWITHFAGND